MTARELVNSTCSPEMVAALDATTTQCHAAMIELINLHIGLLGLISA